MNAKSIVRSIVKASRLFHVAVEAADHPARYTPAQLEEECKQAMDFIKDRIMEINDTRNVDQELEYLNNITFESIKFTFCTPNKSAYIPCMSAIFDRLMYQFRAWSIHEITYFNEELDNLLTASTD